MFLSLHLKSLLFLYKASEITLGGRSACKGVCSVGTSDVSSYEYLSQQTNAHFDLTHKLNPIWELVLSPVYVLVTDVVEVGPFLGESTALNHVPCQVEMMCPNNAHESLISITRFIIVYQ